MSKATPSQHASNPHNASNDGGVAPPILRNSSCIDLGWSDPPQALENVQWRTRTAND